MGSIVLQLAAFIFIVDAALLFGKADPKGTGAANAVIGGLMAVMGLQIGFTAGGNAFQMILCSLTMAFSMFYLILAWCLLGGYDLKALGWYCLGPGLWALLSALFFLGADRIFAVFSLVWAALFLSAWLNMAFESKPAAPVVRWILAIGSIITLMIPSYLLITGGWPPF